MKYRCESRVILGQPCGENCEVETAFKPAACLKQPVWETWAEVKPAKKKKAEQSTP